MTQISDEERRKRVRLGPGLSIWSGRVKEEYLTDLSPWTKASKVYSEMLDDGSIGSLLDALYTPLLSSVFDAHPAGNTPDDIAAAHFLLDNVNSMVDMDWNEHVEDMLSFLPWGFAVAEKVLEKRGDGRIWLTTLVPVAQETLERWGDMDDLGRVTSFVQRDPVWGTLNEAPMTKLLHFAFRSRKRNPMGTPLLRSMYRAWYFKKNLEVIEAIGAERDTGGSPVAELPETRLLSDTEITELETALAGFRNDENSYLIVPPGVKVTPYGGGAKSYNIREIIRDYQHIIFRRFFADFLTFGTESVGSQSLAKESNAFFATALESIQFRMLSVWNRQLVPTLFHWNPQFHITSLPKLYWRPPTKENIQSLAQAIAQLVGSQTISNSPQLTNRLLDLMGVQVPGHISTTGTVTPQTAGVGPGTQDPLNRGGPIQGPSEGKLPLNGQE